MIEPPAWLAKLSREQQAATPYLGLGFKKSKIPQDVYTRILDRTRESAHRFRPAMSKDEIRSIEAAMLPAAHLEDPAFDEEICRALQGAHETWAGMKLTCSVGGGLWAHQRGSYIFQHVDRTSTGIISSILCVDRQLDEPWPLRIEDIDGRVHPLDLAPGEMLFYEGARLTCGRPWPLRGAYEISMSVHYRPEGFGKPPTSQAEASVDGTEGSPRQEESVHPLTNVDEGHLGGYLRASDSLPGFNHGDPQTWVPDVWRWAVDTFAAESVLDVGCGEAHSTKFFRDLGCRALGVDGSRQAKASSALPDRHVLHDFTEGPFLPEEELDLVWSCEFVEHVEERFAHHFLATFGVARKAVLMTFAGIGQPGWHHVNCQDADYWIEKVESLGFRFDPELTA